MNFILLLGVEKLVKKQTSTRFNVGVVTIQSCTVSFSAFIENIDVANFLIISKSKRFKTPPDFLLINIIDIKVSKVIVYLFQAGFNVKISELGIVDMSERTFFTADIFSNNYE